MSTESAHTTDWKAKLAAFLHDPPDKAYDFSPRHVDAATRNALTLGLEEFWAKHCGQPDWSAAAADRFIFPDGRKPGVSGLGDEISFVHPLTGRTHDGSPILKKSDFPSYGDASDIFSDALPDFKQIENWQQRHWLLWRLWLFRAVTHHSGQRKGAGYLAYLPADTRIPDASIWHHLSVVSALESTRVEGTKELRPAFLKFQLGPVQEFIAQARSTRDLWSGSYLLSWLMVHAMQAVAERCGPDAIIFPSLRGQPLFDWLNQAHLKAAKFGDAKNASKSAWEDMQLCENQELVLTPNFPNLFLAVVPADFDVSVVENALKQEWQKIAEVCWAEYDKYGLFSGKHGEEKRELWKNQVANFWQTSCHVWPWQDVEKTMREFENMPMGGKDSALAKGRKVAESTPSGHRDERCYKSGKLDAGWAWHAHYQLLSHRLDARRQLRNFAAWQTPPGVRVEKDMLSGREEAISDKEWKATGSIRHLFRHQDCLGAPNLIKRIWHKAYLSRLEIHTHGQIENLDRSSVAFDSVLAIAAGVWCAELLKKLGSRPDVSEDFDGLVDAVLDAMPHLEDATVCPDKKTASEWLKKTDAAVFSADFWNKQITAYKERLRNNDKEARATSSEVGLQCLKDSDIAVASFKKAHKLGNPATYYAVLALDGDQIGKWMSGEKTPMIGQVVTAKAAEYFKNNLPADANAADWLKSPRPLSPSYHLQFSEALGNFALYAARRIVEACHGQLIYAGGDDVLAMLPAETAILCARALRLAFQGRTGELIKLDAAKFTPMFDPNVPEGFIKLKEGDWDKGAQRPSEPSWPLLVPGPASTVSVGIAYGHIREPLQDLIQEAQKAEKRAKAPPRRMQYDHKEAKIAEKSPEGWDRDALAVTLFKRSGETLQWGAKFDSPALDLLAWYSQHRHPDAEDAEGAGEATSEKGISSRFPYRLAGLLSAYGNKTPLAPDNADFLEVVKREVAHVIRQQTDKEWRKIHTSEFQKLCDNYIEHLSEFPWQQEDGCIRNIAKPLSEFYTLFLVEAFISRQGQQD